MSELALNVLRIGFVGLLWLFLGFLLYVLWQGIRGQDFTSGGESGWPLAVKGSALKRWFLRSKPSELVVRTGTSQGLRIPLSGNLVSIGRSDDNTLILDEEFVSDHHARLRAREDSWWLEDLSSTNGTWLKGERLTLARPLKVGWLFGIGEVVIEVR